MKFINTLLIIVCFSSISFGSGVHASEINETECSERMQTLLEKHPDAIIVHVKGLVCSSCAIGIRIGLAKIEGINRSKFTNGVELDSSNQYVLLASNNPLDFNLIFQKIYDAGYDPLHLCYMKEDQIIRVEVPEINT